MNERGAILMTTLSDIGFGPETIIQAEALLACGQGEALYRYLRLCRCDLMDDLHRSQKRVDLMDHLLRQTGTMMENDRKGRYE